MKVKSFNLQEHMEGAYNVHIKICGITTLKDISLINELHPDYAGFIFAESKRRVTAEHAASLIKKLDSRIKSIGVFVDSSPEEIARVAEICDLWGIQFHGEYDEDAIKRTETLTGLVTIKCVRTRSAENISEDLKTDADFILFDAYDPTSAGGTGKQADLGLIGAVRADITKPFFLAGGINADNVHVAEKFAPYAIDVSSGVETASGAGKDEEKLRKLFAALGRGRFAD